MQDRLIDISEREDGQRDDSHCSECNSILVVVDSTFNLMAMSLLIQELTNSFEVDPIDQVIILWKLIPILGIKWQIRYKNTIEETDRMLL